MQLVEHVICLPMCWSACIISVLMFDGRAQLSASHQKATRMRTCSLSPYSSPCGSNVRVALRVPF